MAYIVEPVSEVPAARRVGGRWPGLVAALRAMPALSRMRVPEMDPTPARDRMIVGGYVAAARGGSSRHYATRIIDGVLYIYRLE
mgnify:CR=1 FL=1